MNIVESILDFFMRLVRGRIDSVEIRAKSKMLSQQAKVQQQAARTFNRAIDGTIDKARGVAGSPSTGPSATGSAATGPAATGPAATGPAANLGSLGKDGKVRR